MTDSWTEDDEEYREAKAELLEPPPSRTLADEDPAEDHMAILRPMLQFHPQPVPEDVQADRAEMLKRLDGYLDRLEREISKPLIDHHNLALLIETGLKAMELRARVRGVGVYPGAW
jgi:hypothetical protein